jgi:hypothetical protein
MSTNDLELYLFVSSLKIGLEGVVRVGRTWVLFSVMIVTLSRLGFIEVFISPAIIILFQSIT